MVAESGEGVNDGGGEHGMMSAAGRIDVISIYTIGYEGFNPLAWTAAILAHDIQTVVDVRDLPLSRRKGFSKTQLAESLGHQGIDYVHAKPLGNPKSYRDALREGLDFEAFAGVYGSLLDDRSDSLQAILDLATERRVCLLCFEEDPARCHRSLVARRLQTMRPDLIEVLHLRNEHAA